MKIRIVNHKDKPDLFWVEQYGEYLERWERVGVDAYGNAKARGLVRELNFGTAAAALAFINGNIFNEEYAILPVDISTEAPHLPGGGDVQKHINDSDAD